LAKLNAAKSSNTFVHHNSGQSEEIWILGSRFGRESKMAGYTLDSSKLGITSDNVIGQNGQSVVLQMVQLAQDDQFAELRKQALFILAVRPEPVEGLNQRYLNFNLATAFS
jgi:hypothetical protein